jgi:DNA-binding CsgD family transcriptional regulator
MLDPPNVGGEAAPALLASADRVPGQVAASQDRIGRLHLKAGTPEADGEILTVVGGLYDAALGQKAWPEVLSHLARLLGGSGATLRREPSPRPRDAPEEQEPRGGLRWREADATGRAAEVTVFRPAGQPAWNEREAALLRYLGSHLSRALRLDHRFAAEATGGGTREAPTSRPISPRERECLACVSRELGLSSHTVDEHVRSAMAKLGATTRTEAVMRAMEQGLLTP